MPGRTSGQADATGMLARATGHAEDEGGSVNEGMRAKSVGTAELVCVCVHSNVCES